MPGYQSHDKGSGSGFVWTKDEILTYLRVNFMQNDHIDDFKGKADYLDNVCKIFGELLGAGYF